MAIEVKKIPELLPAVYFPPQDGAVGQWHRLGWHPGKFGPFAGQMFVGDQAASTVMRVVPGTGGRALLSGAASRSPRISRRVACP